MTQTIPTPTINKGEEAQANIAAISSALKALEASAAANNDTAVPRHEITLTDLIKALNDIGVNVPSPVELMTREQALIDAEKAALESINHDLELRAQRVSAAQARRTAIEETMKRLDERKANRDATAAQVPSDVDNVDENLVITVDSDDEVTVSDVSFLGTVKASTAGVGTKAENKAPVSGDVVGNKGVSGDNKAPVSGDVIGDKGISEEVMKGFVCVACNTYNLLRPSKESWYVVTTGRKVGVFQDWCVVAPLVTGYSHACFKRYNSEVEATRAFQDAVALGMVNY